MRMQCKSQQAVEAGKNPRNFCMKKRDGKSQQVGEMSKKFDVFSVLLNWKISWVGISGGVNFRNSTRYGETLVILFSMWYNIKATQT